MTTTVIVDADELERFARTLHIFTTQIQDGAKHLAGESNRLAETWRDPAHERFARELEQTMGVLHQFIRSSEAYLPVLLNTARRARQVHG